MQLDYKDKVYKATYLYIDGALITVFIIPNAISSAFRRSAVPRVATWRMLRCMFSMLFTFAGIMVLL